MLRPITLVAHRGYSSEAPENTIAAFDLALERGFTDIEFDTQLSKDGVVMIMHDNTLERTTNGHGALAKHTYAQLKKLDAGSWFSPDFHDQRIPTLLELLARYKSRAHLHIELKSGEPDLPQKVAEALNVSGWLEAHPLLDRVISRRPPLVISSFNRDQLQRSIKILPEGIIHELLVETVSEESLQWASMNGVRSYHPAGTDITPELVKYARSLNLHIGAWWWTREDQDAHAIATYGARYAFVDEPRAHRRNIFRPLD